MKAVIPAAGFGTRFLPLTKAQPKEMLPVVNKPTIQWVVEEAVAAGKTEIAKITGAFVKGITLSENQYSTACQRAQEEGLSDKVSFALQDYRHEQDTYLSLIHI